MVEASYRPNGPTACQLWRGLVEFALPSSSEPFRAAHLIVTETSRLTSTQAVSLTVASYNETDLAITSADFDRPVTPLSTFPQQSPQIINVTALLNHLPSNRIGFRVQLSPEPDCTNSERYGSVFMVRLEGVR